MSGKIIFTGLGSGDDGFALGMSAVWNFIEISDVFALVGFVHQTVHGVRPDCWLGAAKDRISQLPARLGT
jgi:hypothetical protein